MKLDRKLSLYDLSDEEKQDVAEELMMPTGVFGALLVAGLLCVVCLWQVQSFAVAESGPIKAQVARTDASKESPAGTLATRWEF